MLAVLSDAMAAGKEIATPVIERAYAALSSLADAFEANPSQTEDIKAAASQAREMANRLSQYTTTVASVTNGQIPSLSSKEIIGRIKAGVDAGTIDFMENTPEEISATFSDIMDGKDVSEEDAKSVSDFLYGRYKQIMDIRTDLQNKIEEEASPEKKAKLNKSLQAINDVLSRLNGDIETSVKYQQEKALQDEASGTRKKAPLGEPAPAPASEPATITAQEFDPGNIDQVAADYQQKTGDVLTEKMATALKTVAKLLAKVAPNVRIYVHSTTQEFIDAVTQEGVNEDLSNRAGTVVQGYDGRIESLHVNLELAIGESAANAARFVYHEAAHVLLDVYFRSDYYGAPQPGLIFDMADEIRSVLPSKFRGPLAEFVARYKGDSARDRVNQAEESIAELIDMLANDESKLDKPTIVKIIAVINKLNTAACEKLGVDPEKYLLSNNRSDLIDFVNSTSRAVKSGLSSDLSEKAITRLQRKYAVQEQTTGEVPVQSRTKAGRTLAKGESKTGPKETAQEGKEEKIGTALVDADGKRLVSKATKLPFVDVISDINHPVFGPLFKWRARRSANVSMYGGRSDSEGIASSYNGEIRYNVNHSKFTEYFSSQDYIDMVMAHEVIHDIVYTYIKKDKQAFTQFESELTSLRDILASQDLSSVSENIKNYVKYILAGNPEEMVTYPLTDPEVAEYFNTIKVPGAKGKNNTVWTKLVDSILNVVRKATSNKTLLDSVVETFNKYTEDFPGYNQEFKTEAQKASPKGVAPSRNAEVLFTTATLRNISEITSKLVELTKKYDVEIKKLPLIAKEVFDSEGSKAVRTIKNLAGKILDNYGSFISEVSESIGVKVISGNYYIGSWNGFFEPSMNISFNITDDTNTQALSDLFNQLAEETSQDAFIIEAVAEQDQEFKKTGKIILATELENGTSIYPQVRIEFKDELSVSEKAGIAKILSEEGFEAFSVGDNFVKMSSFASDIDGYENEKSKFESAVRDSEFSGLYNKTIEQIKQSNYISGEQDGDKRNYNRGDIFEAFKPSAKQSRPKQTKAGRTGAGGRRSEMGSLAPLEGAPVIKGAEGPDPALVAVAEQYAKDNGINLKRQSEYVIADPERGKRIAKAYEEMISDPSNPKVKKAYKELIDQTKKQYEALVKAGYEFTFFDGNSDPYDGNPSSAMRDLRANKSMAVYGTYDGYGTEGVTDVDVKNNPMLEDTGFQWKDQSGELRPVTANDLFRAVHDAFGHGLEGVGFRANGEENAWQSHVRLFTGDAIAAITSETRGQNSWLNFGPYGKDNRTAKVQDTIFAENKIGLLPEWTWTEGIAGDMESEASSQEIEQLRADEQAELDSEIKNAEKYRVDGKVDRTKLTKEEDIKAFDRIYRKYDKLISPLLENQPSEKQAPAGKKTKAALVGEIAQLGQDIRDNLQVARDMEASENDAKTIRLATGWERGKDDKWRYEIPDGKLVSDKNIWKLEQPGRAIFVGDLSKKNPATLDAIIDNPELFRLYPQLKDIKVDGVWSRNGSIAGVYMPAFKTIKFTSPTKEGARSIILHEIQHAIQDIEGFAMGGNPSQISTPNQALQRMASGFNLPKLSKEQKAIAKEKTKERGLRFSEVFFFDVIKDDPDILEEVIERLEILNEVSPNEIYQKLIEGVDLKIMEMGGENIAVQKYKKLAGEVEARNVQKRAEYTPEQRRERTLQETEDVAREDQVVIFGVDKAPTGKRTKAGKTKAGSFKNGYDPNEAADRGTQEDRELQKKIYDAALEIWDSTKDLMDMTADIYEAVEDKLGIPLNPIHIAELVKDLRAGTRPEYSKTQDGKYKRSKTRLNVSSVMDSALEALSNLATNRRVDKGIIASLIKALKGGPQYTVENQMDIDAIADALFDIFGGSANLTTLQELYSITEMTKGGLRSSMFARIANDAWNKARESKDQQEKLAYREIGNKALMQLAQEATEAGRFNAMIYRIQKLNPEFLASFEKSKAREETESQMRDPGKKKSQVVSVTADLNTAQTQAAEQAVNSPSVQASINNATGTPPGPSTPPPAKKRSSTTKTPPAPKPPKPPGAAPSPNKEVDARIKDLKGKLKDIFSGKKTKAARILPAGMNPEILDIITELARNYIKKGITDRTALISKINGDITAAGGSVTMDYFTEMWNEVQTEAVQQRNSAAAGSLANRIVGKVKGAVRTSTKTFDPIAELITDLVNKATEDVDTPKKAKESPLEKIKRLLVEFNTAKEIWIASKARVEAKIDGLDPQRFTIAEKAEMKDMLDAFFENDLSYFEIKKTSTPSPDTTVRNAIKQEMKDKKLKIEEILLMANSKKATTKDEFIQGIVDDIVFSTGISYNQAIKIAEDFASKYDQIVTKKQESILKKRSNPRRVNNIKKKSQGQRAFEMIKYGALDPSIEIHDKDGNIIDSAMLLAELFGVPYLDDVTKDALDVYAEAIADTPEGVIRQQVINDMMMFMKMHQYRQLGSLGDRIMSQFYANLLTSTDTLLKAFNSNVLMNPFEYLAIATRAAVKRDFALIPLLTRGFYQQKGIGSVKELKATQAMSDVDGYVINQGESYYLFNDKTVMSLANPKAVALSGHYEGLLRYSASINQARGVLENIVTHENFTNNVTGAVYEKHAKTRAGRTWGKYVTLAQKGLGALDALVTAGATGARYSDLLYDAIKFYAKSEGVKIKGSEIAKIVSLLQGYSPMIQLDAYNQAIAEMESVEGGPVDLSNRNKKTLLLLRVEEIVRDKMKDRYQQAVNEHPWLSALGQQEIADMLEEAKEISTKIGLMGTAPGTGGVLSHLLGLPGKTVRFSNMQYGAFTNAPVNAASFVLLGNTPLGALVTGVRLLKSERGLGLGSDEFFKKQGIRTKMYGKTTASRQLSKSASLTWNLEKQDMLTKFVLIQAPVIAMTLMAANAVMVALASMFDDDEDRDKLLKDGIEFLRTIPQKDRELMFFGDPLSPDAKKKAGVWKTLPFYTTGAMYGYADGGYGKMQSLRARFGVEPYTVYSYGRKIFSYKDNPLLGAFFMEMASSTDALLFNDSANLEDTQLGMIMVSTWSQLNLIRDQSNLRSISEIVELFAGQRAYEGLDGYNARVQMYLSKTAANILSNLTLPAEMKNLNQDIMAMVGQYMDDPKQFHEFVVYRWPIIGSAVIEGDKTGPFGYPLKVQPKRIFPIGTEQFKLPLMLDGTLDVPTIDQLLSTDDARYTALFERNKNDKFLKPGISGYYKLDKYGDYEKQTFTLEQQKKIREEYKLIMREFAEENIDLVQSPKEFNLRLKIFLGLYGAETGKNRVGTVGYKRYIINKVMGAEANNILLDEADGLYNMNEDQLILDKIKETEEGFEPLPR
jgi:hypothetical protein